MENSELWADYGSHVGTKKKSKGTIKKRKAKNFTDNYKKCLSIKRGKNMMEDNDKR